MGKHGRGEVEPVDDVANVPRQTRQRSSEVNGTQNNGQAASSGRRGLESLDLPNLQVMAAMSVGFGMGQDRQGQMVDESVLFGDPNDPEDREGGCRCGRTKCLKQYCQCFRNDTRCGPDCMCDDCHNDGQHEKERINAIRHIRRSNVTAFKGTKLEVVDQTIKTPRGTLKVVRGCRCKRSKCKKKYCECYGAGLPCTINCVCTECENGNTLSSPRIKDVLKQDLPPSKNKSDRHQAAKKAAATTDSGSSKCEPSHRRNEAYHNAPHRHHQPGRGHHEAPRGSSGMVVPAPHVKFNKKKPNIHVDVPNPARAAVPPQLLRQQQQQQYAQGQYTTYQQMQQNVGYSAGPQSAGSSFARGFGDSLATPTAVAATGWSSAEYGTPSLQREPSLSWGADSMGMSSGGQLGSDGTMVYFGLSPRTRNVAKASASLKHHGGMQATSMDEGPVLIRDSSSGFGIITQGSAWDVSPRGPKLDFKLPSQEGGEPMSTSRSARMGMSPRTDLSNIPVSPMVDGIWGGIGDMDGILSEPMSARAWASHLPDPDSKRQSSGIAREASSVGREVSGLASIARARAEVSGLDSILREPSLGALGTPRSLADPWAGAGTR